MAQLPAVPDDISSTITKRLVWWCECCSEFKLYIRGDAFRDTPQHCDQDMIVRNRNEF